MVEFKILNILIYFAVCGAYYSKASYARNPNSIVQYAGSEYEWQEELFLGRANFFSLRSERRMSIVTEQLVFYLCYELLSS